MLDNFLSICRGDIFGRCAVCDKRLIPQSLNKYLRSLLKGYHTAGGFFLIAAVHISHAGKCINGAVIGIIFCVAFYCPVHIDKTAHNGAEFPSCNLIRILARRKRSPDTKRRKLSHSFIVYIFYSYVFVNVLVRSVFIVGIIKLMHRSVDYNYIIRNIIVKSGFFVPVTVIIKICRTESRQAYA